MASETDLPQTDAEWHERLTPEQYHILREKGTEAPFTGLYVDEKRPGMYRCAACGNELFSSEHKFESGSGWPSYDQAIPGSVRFERDTSFGMERTEVLCARCGSHLGHVFDDVPWQERDKRYYCVNSACLAFDPETEQEKKNAT